MLTTPPHALAIALVLLPSCSSLPQAQRPPFVDHDVVVRYVVPPEGWLTLPTSADDVVIAHLRVDPTPRAERHGDRGRQLQFEPGSAVTVRAAVRSYGGDGRAPAAAPQLFPGAASISAGDAAGAPAAAPPRPRHLAPPD